MFNLPTFVCDNFVQPRCGLPISTYFSAVKMRWLLDNNSEVQRAVKDKRCLFGTVDSWLTWVSVFPSHFCVWKCNCSCVPISTIQEVSLKGGSNRKTYNVEC